MFLTLYNTKIVSIQQLSIHHSCLAVVFVFHTPLTYFSLVMGPPAEPLPDSVRGDCRQSSRRCGWVVELGICDWHQHKSPFISRSYAELHGQTQIQARVQARAQPHVRKYFSVIWVSGARVHVLLIFSFHSKRCTRKKEKDYANIAKRSNLIFLFNGNECVNTVFFPWRFSLWLKCFRTFWGSSIPLRMEISKFTVMMASRNGSF